MAYPALYTRQDRDQQSMKQRCVLNERKDKSPVSIELFAYIKYYTCLHYVIK